ncbi:hypothetical protein HELRODRAFT_108236 [Helobdella robusta]|uniref:Translin n=1 Tax=Helobdella robusta TaxID=6412 RepID=T1EEH5_HELRO|nr:hypothetical protein HELRODRAFT_108236 [Helobdella robusta]ESN93035.1 hypothetical protein HELRODRAFT_108236 [Helobdella robusta]
MSSGENITKAFLEFQDGFNYESEIKESIKLVVRELEEQARNILNTVQAIHHKDGFNNVRQICENCSSKLREVQTTLKALESKFSLICYYKYNDLWRMTMQKLCFLACYIAFLTDQSFLPHHKCAEIFAISTSSESGFHLELEDYLIGQLMLASELSRLSTNAVTAGMYDLPIRIARFMAELDSGFRLLNLKNDWLRKRYDGLKYDLKKVEEIVYDLSIRGLRPLDADKELSS